MRRLSPNYPVARRDDEVSDFFGLVVTTPFRWLNDVDSAETRAWIAAQNALTDDFFDGDDARARRRAEHRRFLELWAREAPRILPIERGGCVYRLEQPDHKNQPSLWCETESAKRLVVDVEAESATIEPELVSVSPSGRYVAYGLARGGRDGGEIHVWDAQTGRTLPDTIAQTAVPTVAWHPSERGFFYNVTRRILGAEIEGQDDGVYWHRLGDAVTDDVLLVELDRARAEKVHGLYPFVPDGGDVLFVVATNFVTSARGLEFWPLPEDPAAGVGAGTHLIDDAEAPLAWLGARGRVHFWSTRLGAARGRVLGMDLDHPERERWRVVVPEGDDALTTDTYTVRARLGTLSGDRLLLTYLHHASHRVRVFDLDGDPLGELALPPLVTVEEIVPSAPGGARAEALVSTADLLRPHVLYRWREGSELEVVEALPTPLNDADFEVERMFVSARDGVKVPLTIARPRSLDRAAPAPLLLYGYGGWGQSITPRYSPEAACWLALGGIYAYANLRGGGEYGDAWRAAGQGVRKQTVFDDFHDTALHLIASGVTTPAQLGIRGLSNGGLLTAACYNQRPDLYGAAISEIPLADVMWLDQTDKGRAVAAELGNPRESREVAAALHAYSPL
ncbi:MAG TPA: prolyl oligopeptidase family serine peptidase, partial [Thermoanaerobaculia bacterium]|nr:prolyl oligopeptidase family serine peptidase [Thermoanaerobaculia bacterium]